MAPAQAQKGSPEEVSAGTLGNRNTIGPRTNKGDGRMRDRHIASGIAATALALLVGGGSVAMAGQATDRLKPEIDKVVTTLENPALKGDGKTAERRQALRTITDGVFDWNEMAKRALGRHWAARTPAEQQEFVGLFRDLL